MEDDIQAEVITESRNKVQEDMDTAIIIQEELADLAPSASLEGDGEDRLDEMEEEHSFLMRETMRIIIQLKGGTHSSKSGSPYRLSTRCLKFLLKYAILSLIPTKCGYLGSLQLETTDLSNIL